MICKLLLKRKIKINCLFLLVCILFVGNNLQGQAPCGLKEAMTEMLANAKGNPPNQNSVSRTCVSEEPYEIPLVFHVLHDNGPENISDGQIHQAIEQLNEQYAGAEGGFDTKISFYLATVDPEGNCTDGINRIHTLTPGRGPEGFASDEEMKDLSRWPVEDYANVWIVKFLFGSVAGYSYIPPLNNQALDGVVVKHDNLGTTGTAEGNIVNALSHELGHYLGLYHLWGREWFLQGEDPCEINCDETDCENNGDMVCDTDPMRHAIIGYNGCDFTPSNCEQCPDFPADSYFYEKDNYMSYAAGCQDKFTEGQAKKIWCDIENYRPLLHKPYLPPCRNDCPTLVDGNTIIDTPTTFGGDVIVADGGTLTITSGVRFGEFKKLIVQDGGTLIITGPLAKLNACPDAIRWEGIEVQSGGTLIIDEGYIHDAFYAIHAMPGSHMDIFSIYAFGDGTFENARNGIWLDGEVNVNQLHNLNIGNYYTGIKCNNNSSYYNIHEGLIEDCYTGIHLTSAPSRISDFDIFVRKDAIHAFQSPGMLIEGNDLNVVDNNNHPDSRGINMWWCDASVIGNNTIGSDSKAPGTGIAVYLSHGGIIRDMNVVRGARTGIIGFNTDFGIIRNDISVAGHNAPNRGAVTLIFGNGNQILNNYIDARHVTYGINTRVSSGTQIENNDITTSFDATFHRAAGIKSEGCNSELIANNTVTGIGNTDGIIATNTAGNTYDCNHAVVSGTKEALSVLYNSQGQSVKGNDLSANGNDLLIRSIIGEQVHEGNTFVGGNALAEDQDIAFASKFYVNSTYSFHMPTYPDPVDWFIDQPHIHNYYVCANTPGPNWIPFWDDEDVLCTYYMRIIDTYGYGSREYIRMIQTMLRYGQQRIDFDLPACIKDDPILPDCWESLVDAEHMLTYEDNGRGGERSDLLNEIEALSLSQASGNGPAYHASHKSDIAALASSLSGARPEYDHVLRDVEGILGDIDCTDSIISIALPILEEYIRYLEAEDRSAFDYTTLIRYSRLCADDYGPYIHLARGIVYPMTDEYFDQYDDCRLGGAGTREARATTNNNISAYIYPNPSTGRATLDFGKKASGRIEVSGISGNKIMARNFNNNNSVDLDLSGHIGVHLIHIYYNNGAAEVVKHISIK